MGKFKNAMYRFLQGRYGNDKLNNFLLVFAIGLVALNTFVFHNYIVMVVGYILLVLIIFRSYSKKIYKRQKENIIYMRFTRPIRSRFSVIRKGMKDREHRYFLCPNCKQITRVPKGRGKIEITCPKCKQKFSKRS